MWRYKLIFYQKRTVVSKVGIGARKRFVNVINKKGT